MKTLYRQAQTYISIARLISAAFYSVIAASLIAFALWLAFPFGEHWFLTAIALLVGLQGAVTAVKAAEIFLSTRPPERSDRQHGRASISRREQGRAATTQQRRSQTGKVSHAGLNALTSLCKIRRVIIRRGLHY